MDGQNGVEGMVSECCLISSFLQISRFGDGAGSIIYPAHPAELYHVVPLTSGVVITLLFLSWLVAIMVVLFLPVFL